MEHSTELQIKGEAFQLFMLNYKRVDLRSMEHRYK